jgi:hypothetical protein
MDIEGKKVVILKAIGRYGARKIDPESGGKYAYAVKNGKTVSNAMVERLYKQVLALDSNLDSCLDSTLDKTLDTSLDSGLAKPLDKNLDSPLDSTAENLSTLASKLEHMALEIFALREENSKLKREIDEVKRRLDNHLDSSLDSYLDSTLDSGLDKPLDKVKIHGFFLTKRQPFKNGRFYWYAGRLVAGKQVWLYIGKDASKAEEKINAYCQKNSAAI